ncbi:cysteine proteinase inhibitor 1-like [Andrographis paniculata]|uniref:cysteine proteinase inhibitor 1-like n=1 Tax=Andrographis paniculata TaxID=175694 RepID=UPI0021E851C9|nr:cysteine proteinase inhibitor 1-like [Andrographis paniculata]
MAQKSVSYLMLFALLLAASLPRLSSSAAAGGRKALEVEYSGGSPVPPGTNFGGYNFLSSKDAKAIELAKFSIEENNKKSNQKLKYDAVLEALWKKVAQGAEYRLVVLAVVGDEPDAYDAEVAVDEKNDKRLVRFEKLH